MSALQKRVSKLEGPIEAGEKIDIIIQLIEPGTMQVTSRLRLITGGGALKVDEDVNEIEARIIALEANQ
ncbi:MAG: hypothetical protein ABTR92_04905 [Candidatus Accumulibacter phosphatis]|uniref:hypothetical protein n=1 Tax=Candidatus Accumulibacter sp. ACC012 TaxID=2823332 RepID=UPI0025B8DE75|nr:hypothetical protein [Candidatus Accumulibacter sp. ACC012]